FVGTTSAGGTYGDGNVFQLFLSGGPKPALGSISPASIDAGSNAFTLTANGTNFVTASVVQWKGSPLTTTYVSLTQLKAHVPASLISSPGTATITVFTPGATGGTTGGKTFTILVTSL